MGRRRQVDVHEANHPSPGQPHPVGHRAPAPGVVRVAQKPALRASADEAFDQTGRPVAARVVDKDNFIRQVRAVQGEVNSLDALLQEARRVVARQHETKVERWRTVAGHPTPPV